MHIASYVYRVSRTCCVLIPAFYVPDHDACMHTLCSYSYACSYVCMIAADI